MLLDGDLFLAKIIIIQWLIISVYMMGYAKAN